MSRWSWCGSGADTAAPTAPQAPDAGTAARASRPDATPPEADASARARSAEIDAGTRIGDYVVEARRGSGGFAAVYRARDVETGAPVAIKVLHAFLARTASVRRRFWREAETIARLAHPRIVRLLAHGEHDGLPYLVMAWLEGETLAEVIRARGAIPLDEAMPIFEALAGALAAAHAHGVVHRDLKAANVALTDDGATLLDFGIAKLADVPSGGFTTPGARLGTPHYMAPEQLLGRSIDPRTDVYAFGILVFEAVTGRRPFDGPSLSEVEERQLTEPPPAPSRLAAVPAALDAVIARAMAKQPDHRHATIGELLAELRAVAAGTPAPPPRHPAVALYLHAPPWSIADDDALDRLDRLVARARGDAARLGLEVAAEVGGSLLLLGVPREGDAAGRLAELEAFAREVAADADGAGTPVALTVHVGDVELADGRSVPRFVGGALLDVGAWARTDAPGVHVTAAARWATSA
jgi:hypothetical protein